MLKHWDRREWWEPGGAQLLSGQKIDVPLRVQQLAGIDVASLEVRTQILHRRLKLVDLNHGQIIGSKLAISVRGIAERLRALVHLVHLVDAPLDDIVNRFVVLVWRERLPSAFPKFIPQLGQAVFGGQFQTDLLVRKSGKIGHDGL